MQPNYARSSMPPQRASPHVRGTTVIFGFLLVRHTIARRHGAIACALAALHAIAAQAQTTPSGTAIPDTTTRVQIKETTTDGFVHPGIGLTKAMLENARAQVIAKREPWLSGYRALATHPYSAPNATARNESKSKPGWPDVDAFDSRGMDGRLKPDAAKAKQQVLMYILTGEDVYRANALRIVRVWSRMDPAKYKPYPEHWIHPSYAIQDLIIAAELLRYSSVGDLKLAWTDADTAAFTKNFLRPAIDTFMDTNGRFMNQNGYPLSACVSAAIFTSDRERYARHVHMFTVNPDAPNKGWSFSIQDLARRVDTNAITGEKAAKPAVQLMEMGRDQAHAADDVDIFANIGRQLNAQGTKVDPVAGTISTSANAVGPYEFLDDRILAAADQFCRFMLGYDTPWIPVAYDIGPRGDVRGIYPRIADNYRGRIRGLDFWDMYYHYAYVKGVDVAKKAPYYHEAFSKRIVNSVTDWIYIPAAVAGEGARVTPREQEPAIVQVEQRSTLLSPNATIVEEDGRSFVRVASSAGGARVAILSSATDKKTIGLRVRTTGTAEVAMSGFARPWLLPDTRGQWRYVSYTMSNLEQFRDIVYLDVKASAGTTVDLDELHRKPDGSVTPPTFASGDGDLRVVAYVGAPVRLDFAAQSKAGARTRISSLDKPDQSTLDETSGTFSWRPAQEGEFTFVVNADGGDAAAAKRVQIVVARDRDAALAHIESARDPNVPYTQRTLNGFEARLAQARQGAAGDDDEAFYAELTRLQRAADALEKLSPRLSDGSLNYPPIVASSTLGETVGLLTDGNDDTFPGYFLAKDLRFTLDFGPDYQVAVSGFAMEGRLNFERRTQDTALFGSNDGNTWTQLTQAVPTPPTELLKLEVKPELRRERFRYLKFEKVSKRSDSLFEPAELRIYGERYEGK